jgi:dephospho-CoA kinase
LSSEPYVVGLTGNIATGKSTVGKMLVELGAEHIDADRVAHQSMARGHPAWNEIIEAFGHQILGSDGEVDRAKLGAIVFSDPQALERLERIVHPRVIETTMGRIAASEATVVVVEAIKLIESGMVIELCDTLWVVTAPRQVQIERLVSQRGLSPQEAAFRVDTQPPQSDKIARADVVIDNGGALSDTARQVERAWAAIGAVNSR